MDTLSLADETPVVPLLGRTIEEAWKPCQGSRDGTSVIKF
jgi:hypothetical protein